MFVVIRTRIFELWWCDVLFTTLHCHSCISIIYMSWTVWGILFGLLHYRWKAKSGHFLLSTPKNVASRWIHAWQQQNRSYSSIVIVAVLSSNRRFQKYVFRSSSYFHPNLRRSKCDVRLFPDVRREYSFKNNMEKVMNQKHQNLNENKRAEQETIWISD